MTNVIPSLSSTHPLSFPSPPPSPSLFLKFLSLSNFSLFPPLPTSLPPTLLFCRYPAALSYKSAPKVSQPYTQMDPPLSFLLASGRMWRCPRCCARCLQTMMAG